MKSNTFRYLLLATISVLSSPCQAIESIGWNYDGVGDDTLSPTDSAGASGFAQNNWNNHAGNGQGPGTVPFSLLDNAGVPSGTSVTAWTQTLNNSWRQGQSADADQKLMNSFATRQPAITWSNIPASYVTSGYTVVVYYGNNEGPSTSTLSITGSVNDSRFRAIRTGATAESSYGVVGYLQETGDLAGPTNYTIFTGLNDPTFTVALAANNNNGFCAVQIVKETGAPSAPASPSPTDFNGDLATTISFDWADSLRATSYEFYLWKTNETEPLTPTATTTGSSYDPPSDLVPSTDYNWLVKAVNVSGATAGPVWTFSTGEIAAPGEVDFPFPESGETGIPVGISLEWDVAPRAASYDIYLWKSSDPKPANPTATTTSAIYTPDSVLQGGTTFLWQVTSVNSTGSTEGPQWTFTTGTPPAVPMSPAPAQGSNTADRLVTLDWADSAGAESYKVYLWPSSGTAPTEPIATVTTSSLGVPEVLAGQTTYQWRIDPVNSFGTTPGPLWTFTTTGTVSALKSIGWKYDGIPEDTLDPTEVAGVPPYQQAFWNNHRGVDADFVNYGQGPGVVPFPLGDNQGTTTTASVTAWTLVQANSWFQDQNTNPNEKLMNSFSCTQPSITFSGIPADYCESGYTVVVYYGNNEGPSTSTLTLTGSANDAATRDIRTGDKSLSSYGLVGFVAETGLLSGSTNHTVFTGMNDASFTIAMTGANNNGFCAIQIVKTDGAVTDGFTNWAGTHGLVGADAAFDADPDNDGISNGIEFVLGGEPNPANAGFNSAALLPTMTVSGNNLVFVFKRTGASAYLNPYVEFSTTLRTWTTASAPANATIVVTPGSPSDTVTVTIPVGSASATFARLTVNKP